jgi:hypothetical protein
VATQVTKHDSLAPCLPLTKTCQLFMQFLSNDERQFPVTHDEVRRYFGDDFADKLMLELCATDDLLQMLGSHLHPN